MRGTDQKRVLVALCQGIIENAEAITADWNYTQRYTVRIEIDPERLPSVTVEKEFIPAGVIEVLQERGAEK